MDFGDTGVIFTKLVKQEISNECPSCKKITESCIIPKKYCNELKTTGQYLQFFERFIQNPQLIKTELEHHCHVCDAKFG